MRPIAIRLETQAAEAFEKAIAIDPALETARENLRALTSR